MRKFHSFKKPLLGIVLACLVSVASAQSVDEEFKRGRELFEQQSYYSALGILQKLADKGHAESQVIVGLILDQGGETPRALTYYEKAAAQGNAEGQYLLGALLYAGDHGIKKDLVRAQDLFRKAAKGGSVSANAALAAGYIDGTFVFDADSKAEAMKSIESSLAGGDQKAFAFFLDAYGQGNEKFGIAKSPEKVVAMIEARTKDDNVDMMQLMARVYRDGLFGVQKSEEKAREWDGKVRKAIRARERAQRKR